MIRLFGIKNCDTVKKARKWLEINGIDYQFHDFREDGLSKELLAQFEEQLGWELLLNKRSTSWRQLSKGEQVGINKSNALELMHNMPTLIKRPVLEFDGSYSVGFKDAEYQRHFEKQ